MSDERAHETGAPAGGGRAAGAGSALPRNAAPRGHVDAGAGGSPGTLGKRPRILLWIAGAIVAVLALIGIFLLGTRLPDLLAPAPIVTPTPTPTPTPTETVEPVGPVEPGEYRWDDLLGGECLDPYVDAWQDEYTVVDCAEAHGGQLIARVTYDLGAEDDAPYPGREELSAPLYLACTDPAVLDRTAAGAYDDLAVQSSYPVTAEQWDEGHREYSCFVSRSSGEPLTGSLAVPPVEQ